MTNEYANEASQEKAHRDVERLGADGIAARQKAESPLPITLPPDDVIRGITETTKRIRQLELEERKQENTDFVERRLKQAGSDS